MAQHTCIAVATLLVLTAVYVAADPPNLPPYSIYQNDNTADNSNLDPTLLNTGLKPWTPPAAPSGAMPNQPPYLPAGPDILPGFNTSRAPPTQLSRTGNCVLDGLAEAGLITLLKSLNYTGLNTTFKGYATATGNVTILAPTDEAFATWTGSLRYLPSTTLKSILQYHVLPGGYNRRKLAETAAQLATAMPADAVASTCGGSGKPTLGVTSVGNSVVLEGAASAAVLTEADVPLCGGKVMVQVVSQVLQPCCLDTKALLAGGSGRKPVLVNTTEASVAAFQEALTAAATSTAAAPIKAIFVPTEAAWTAFNFGAVLGAVGDITPAQREAVLKSLAAYHISREGLDLKALAASAAAGSKGRVLSVLGGANEASQWSCPQMVNYEFKNAGSVSTFLLTSDDSRTSGRIVGYYQTCSGVNVYQVDEVLMPCDLLKTAGIKGGLADSVDGNVTAWTNVAKNGAGGMGRQAGVAMAAMVAALLALLL